MTFWKPCIWSICWESTLSTFLRVLILRMKGKGTKKKTPRTRTLATSLKASFGLFIHLFHSSEEPPTTSGSAIPHKLPSNACGPMSTATLLLELFKMSFMFNAQASNSFDDTYMQTSSPHTQKPIEKQPRFSALYFCGFFL